MNALTNFIETAYALLKQGSEFRVNDWVISDTMQVLKIEEVYQTGTRKQGERIVKASPSNPVYSTRLMEKIGKSYQATDTLFLKVGEELQEFESDLLTETEYTFSTCTFTKMANGALYVYGIFSSYYMDSDGDILTSKAHQNFAKGINEGKYPLPEINIAHIAVAIGKCEMIDYHTDGFMVFGGRINDSWVEDVETIIHKSLESDFELGLSHGFMNSTVEFDDDGYISKYISHEVSILPLFSKMVSGGKTTSASNKYTALLTA